MQDTPSPKPPSANADSSKSKAVAAHAEKPPVSDYKAPLLNPLWAEEVAKSHGLTGKLAKSVAVTLCQAVEKDLVKATKRARLTKLVIAALAENVGNYKP